MPNTQRYWQRLPMLQFIQDLINSENELDQEDGWEYMEKLEHNELLLMN